MNINSISDFRAAIRQGPYAWPGGYPVFFVCADGGVLSFKAAKSERRAILEALASGYDDQWRVIATQINWEDSYLNCDHTGERIEVAYPDEEYPDNVYNDAGECIGDTTGLRFSQPIKDSAAE